MAKNKAAAEQVKTPVAEEIQSFSPPAEPELGSAVTAPPMPATQRFRVSVDGAKVRSVDPEKGTVTMQDHLDVEAVNEGEAIMKFHKYNGIISTSKVPMVSRL